MKSLAYNPIHPPSKYIWERMEEEVPLIDRALKCVVFIGLRDPTSLHFNPYGTGFVFTAFSGDIQFDYIITCHHVIQIIPGDKVWVRVNLKDGSSTLVESDKGSWLFDKKQDIAVLCQEIGEFADVLRLVDKDFLTDEVLRYKEQHYKPILPGEETILVGLFTSHYGKLHNIPIVRIGNIAAMPDDPIFTNNEYVKAYLIETRSIGGLSGSPVFLSRFASGFFGMMLGRLLTTDLNDLVHTEIRDDKKLMEAIEQLSPELKRTILGLMEMHFLIDDINTGIGVVIPAQAILDFINEPAFTTQREETMKKLKKESLYHPCGAIPVSADNPQHKEDFNSLLAAAAKKKPPTDET